MKKLFLLILVGFIVACPHADETNRWWKGNLHTHTLWSDGDDFPEMVAEWYKTNQYHFLAISDHNIMLEDERWFRVIENPTFQTALQKYRDRFPDRVKIQSSLGRPHVRLSPLSELKNIFEEKGKFLFIPSEEISASYSNTPVHINATNLRELIKPLAGTNIHDVMQKNIDAVLEQRQRTGQPMFPHLNHPNFFLAVSPEELMRVQGERFFEVYNGHPLVLNEGDATHPSTEKMWDIILAWRLAILKMEPMYGIAVDDSHNYHQLASTNSNPGRGWIMVRSKELAPEAVVHAMEAGDFYASTGVVLKEVTRTTNKITLEIQAEVGVDYEITFVGTKNFAKPGGAEPQVDVTQIGRLLAPTLHGTQASYTLGPDDLYARAVVRSSKRKEHGLRPDETERAWTQPIIPPGYLFLPAPFPGESERSVR